MRIIRIASIAAAIGSLITACVFGKTKTIDPSQAGTAPKSIYDIQLKTLDGIKTAIMLANTGDIILVAGKGHETYQDIMGVKHPFDDKAIITDTFKLIQ